MSTQLKTLWNRFTTILIALVLILTMALVGVRLFGLEVYTVLSGSMEPSYPTGSLLYVKEAQEGEIGVGDVITFAWSDALIATHRVVERIPAETGSQVLYRTKGDANEEADAALVSYGNIIGKPVFAIPKLGYVSHFIQNKPGRYLALAVAAGLLLLVFLPDLIFSGPGKEQTEAAGRRESR